MKKITLIVSFIAFVIIAGAQQNAPVATVKKATPVLKASSQVAPVNSTAETAPAGKACCQGKTAAQCSHDAKTCSGPSKAACCQQAGAQGCNHGATGTEKKVQ